MNPLKVFGVIVILLGFGLFIFYLISFVTNDNQNVKVKQVDCFDDHGNKIVGLTCEEKGDVSAQALFCMIFSFIIIAVGCGICTTGRSWE